MIFPGWIEWSSSLFFPCHARGNPIRAGHGSLRDGAPTPLPQRQALHPSRIGVDIHINEPVAMRLSDAEDAIRAVLRTSGQRRSTSNDAQAEK